jgi:hydroxypyruvate reductase
MRDGTSRLRRDALAIFRAALDAADPYRAVLRHVHMQGDTLTAGKSRYNLKRTNHVYVVGAGKAGATMARAIEKLLGARITQGLVNVKYGHTAKLRRIELNECGHPVPDDNGVAGAARIEETASSAGADDLVICLISGGASALLPLPADPIKLAEKQATTQLLLDSGATIHEINAVRKHISKIKGGQLARFAEPARVLALLLSDVIGDDLDVIGSGPTAPDASTFHTAWSVVEKYRIGSRLPAAVRHRLQSGLRGEVPDTPKPGDPAFDKTQNLIIGSNALALDRAAEKARELGYRPLVLSSSIQGETRDAALFHVAIAEEVRRSGRPVKPPCCVISGGETTVTIRGKGKGGRNQEFALAAAIGISGMPATVVLSGGTDGTDGPTDAAGAIVDGGTIARSVEGGLDPSKFLDANDSYTFFEKTGDLLVTGPTGTNVMDVRLVVIND